MEVELVLTCFCIVFFEESWTELVMATSLYNQETVQRMVNDADMFYPLENTVSILQTCVLRIEN
jgi:hypothetical protein